MNMKEIRYRDSVKFDNFVSGIIWIIVGILNFFQENIIFDIAYDVFLCLAILRSLISIFTINKREVCDEMASRNMKYAMSIGYVAMLSMINVGIILVLVLGLCNVDYQLLFFDVFPFFLGISQIVIGIVFLKSEKGGEEWLD